MPKRTMEHKRTGFYCLKYRTVKANYGHEALHWLSVTPELLGIFVCWLFVPG